MERRLFILKKVSLLLVVVIVMIGSIGGNAPAKVQVATYGDKEIVHGTSPLSAIWIVNRMLEDHSVRSLTWF
ncbi:hypothetical protein NQ117_00990 [Paenibacillus sp. SC116]|nr:hypothetical protein [Paenibacillus sp. SC116]